MIIKPCDLQEIIDEIISELKIPEQFHEDASQEGHLAFYERRDLQAAIQYWWQQERSFLTKHSI